MALFVPLGTFCDYSHRQSMSFSHMSANPLIKRGGSWIPLRSAKLPKKPLLGKLCLPDVIAWTLDSQCDDH